MADLPRPRSYPQQLGDILSAFTSRSGISRLKVGDPLLSVMEAAAQSDVRQSQDIFNLRAASDLENAEGLALDLIGNSERIPRRLLAKATGLVDVGDSSFVKKSTKVYHGTGAPIVGTTALNVDGTLTWPSSGSVYIGRRTPNIEGPLTYTSITDNGSYKTLNLSTPTTKFHNQGEGVVLAQGGNRVVDSGQIVATAQGALSSAVQFSVVFPVTIPDGETSAVGVPVVATAAGSQGNVPALSIKEFVGGAPFNGATVSNPRPFVTGRDNETDNSYKDRIRQTRNSRQRGTDLALVNAVIDVTAPDESKRITSAALVRKNGQPSRLFIDDGTGYEETSQGVGIETLVDSASGGEDSFQTLQRPVVKAFLISRNEAPFALSDGGSLTFSVGGVESTHRFDTAGFVTISAASAYEVTASINSNPDLLWSARTAESGTKVVLFARSETNEDISLSSDGDNTAAAAFLFPSTRAFTSLLYKNDRLLSKDGSAAVLRSRSFSVWNVFSGSQTLTVSVDGTPAVTYTFTDQNFIDSGTGFSVVGRNTPAAWASVLNDNLPGITATVEGDKIVITSNRGHSAKAALSISGGTLVSAFVFDISESLGASNDYTVDRGIGQIVTSVGLSAGDHLTLGSAWTRAFLETEKISPFTLASDVDTWWSVDGATSFVKHGVGASTPLTATVAAITEHSTRLRIQASSVASVFSNVMTGDWAVLWDPTTSLPDSLRKAWRVIDTIASGDLVNSILIEKPAAAAARFASASVALTPVGADYSKVLVVGGYTYNDGVADIWTHHGRAVTSECEIFDPNTGTWTATGPMASPRAHHTATLLSDDRVLVVGGYGSDGVALDTTEIWSPISGTWSAGPVMSTERAEHTATAMNNNKVLIVGGLDASNASLATSIEFDTATDTLINPMTMVAARHGHNAVLLPAGAGTAGIEAGNVLVVGGITDNGTHVGAASISTVERYNAGTPGWSAKTSMGFPRAHFGLAVVGTQTVLALGDSEYTAGFSSNQRDTYQVYTVDADSWTSATTVETGWKFTDKRNGLIKPTTNDVAIAYGGVYESGGIKSIRHKKYSGGVWTTIGQGYFSGAGVERNLVDGVALTGGTSPDLIWFFGGLSVGNTSANNTSGNPVATQEMWNDDTASWSVSDDALDLSSDTLSTRGLTIVRTSNALLHAVIPAATNYTATTLTSAINSEIEGVVAEVYRTSRVRIETRSFALGGDISMVASSDTALPVPAALVEENTIGHFASVAAGNSGQGTPADFQVQTLVGTASSPHTSGVEETVYLAPSQFDPPFSGSLVGLRRLRDGLNPRWWESGWVAGGDLGLVEYGNDKNARADIGALDFETSPDRIRVGLRKEIVEKWGATAPAVLALPHSIGPDDDLTVVVDEDTETKRFSVPMWRRLKPTSTSYSSQVALQDFDAGGVPLAGTFGINYDFNDFALFMQARAKSHSSTASKRVLWRYFKHGMDGEAVTMRYAYPDTESASLSIKIDDDQTKSMNDRGGPLRVFADVVLGSGAERSGISVSSTSRLGLARTNGTAGVFDVFCILGYAVVEAQRSSLNGTTRLRIQVPNQGTVAAGPQTSGINVGDALWFQASSPASNTLFSGSFTVASVGSFNSGTGQVDITIPALTLNDGTVMSIVATPGTVSFDSVGPTKFDPATAVGDLVRISESLSASFGAQTMRIAGVGPQYVYCKSLDLAQSGAQTSVSSVALNDTSLLSIFAGPTQTATQVVAAVNALFGDALISPITGTVIGSGSGVIDKATWDELADETAGYDLTDGLNYVQRTVIPGDIVTNTEFVLRAPISSDLQTNSDWINEDVRLVPVLASDIVSWLNTPAVTGLGSSAEIALANGGSSVQIASNTPGSAGSIEVQGGLANSATASVFGSSVLLTRNSPETETSVCVVRRTESDGLLGGRWVAVDNTNGLAKEPWWVSGTSVAVDAAGKWTTGVAPYTVAYSNTKARVQIERVGKFVAIRIGTSVNSSAPSLSNCKEGGYIYLKTAAANTSDIPDIATSNQGVFKIVRATSNASEITIWVENNIAIDQIAVGLLKVIDPGALVPGDKWVVSTSSFGDGNRGPWTVISVGNVAGEQFVDSSFTVDTAEKSSAVLPSTTFGAGGSFVQVVGLPSRFIKKILTIYPHSDDPSYVDVQFDSSAGYREISSAAGSILSAMDKLDFESGIFIGVDGYSYGTGLLQEANRVVYGDPSDEATYPGYASSGASILVQGPTVKRIQITLSLRVQSGSASEDLADRVRSAVAAVINGTPTRNSIAISDLVSAASEVGGVVAVAVIKPNYASTSDVIPVGAGEKALVLDPRTDIQIVFVGE
jgi:hypothetical protein